MIERKEYMEKLRMLRGEHIIKVVTGIRRSGKSTLLEMFRQELLDTGVEPQRVIAINFEDERFADLRDSRALYEYLMKRVDMSQMNYIFLDEVQNVAEFERVVDSFFIYKNMDIYITGSNAYLLSSELATLLTGRYIEISILPFSFSEYAESFPERKDYGLLLGEYMHASTFPYAVELEHKSVELVTEYLRGVYESVYVNDILTRRKIKNERAFENVLKFAYGNIGNSTSPGSIAGTLAVGDKEIDRKTVESYLNLMTKSFLLYKVERFDVRGKQQLTTQEKYYVVDLGLRRIFLGRERDADRGHLLENVIYLELLRRGGRVFVGKVGAKEVDFVVQDGRGEIAYYQVAYTAKEEATLARELAPLQAVKDNYPKYLITTDEYEYDVEGIKVLNAAKWLLDK